MPRHQFTFNGKKSYDDMGIDVPNLPIIPMPQRRVETVKISGRHSNLRFDEGTYDDITIPVGCVVSNPDIPNRVDEIKAWLMCGESDLIFSNQPDKRYRAQVINRIDFAEPILSLGEFELFFLCRPFKQELGDNLITLTASPSVFTNLGAVESEPVMTIYGSGVVTLVVNGKTIILKDVVGSVTIDSVLMDCYKGSINHNKNMQGYFPFLKTGDNTISWTGTVTKVEIVPNWRW